MNRMPDQEALDQFLAQYPVFEYRILRTEDVAVEERVRLVCSTSCPRYGQSWACPPAVGELGQCAARIHSYDSAFFFSSVAEVSDILNMDEMLSTRRAHEDLTNEIADYLKSLGFPVFVLSTESCDLCPTCAYKLGRPCVHPDRMHPCLESHGVVVSDIVEQQQMEYTLGGNTILWFSMILFS